MHVEAGLRTGGSNLTPFPEELNRQVISTIAALHFAPTSANLQNLVRENIPVEQVFVTGNTGIDALHWASRMDVQFANPRAAGAATTATPASSSSPPTGARTGATGCAASPRASPPRRPPTPTSTSSLPVHPNPRVREVLTERLTGLDNVLLTEPLGYADLRPPARPRPPRDHRLRRHPGRGALAGQAGAGHARDDRAHRGPRRRAPCGWSAPTPSVIFAEADRAARRATRPTPRWPSAPNPYGDGHAAERIVAALEHLLLGAEPPTPFGPGYSRAAVASPPASSRRAARPASCSSAAGRGEPRRPSALEPSSPSEPSRRRSRAPRRRTSRADLDLALRGPAGCLGDPLHRLPGRRRRDVRLDGCCSSSAATARSRRPAAAAAGGRRRLHLGLPRPGAERGGDDRRQRRAAARRCRSRGGGSS